MKNQLNAGEIQVHHPHTQLVSSFDVYKQFYSSKKNTHVYLSIFLNKLIKYLSWLDWTLPNTSRTEKL